MENTSTQSLSNTATTRNTQYNSNKLVKVPKRSTPALKETTNNNNRITTENKRTMIGSNNVKKRKLATNDTTKVARSKTSHPSTSSIPSKSIRRPATATSRVKDNNTKTKSRAPWDFRGKVEDIGNEMILMNTEIETVAKLKEAHESDLVSTTSELQQLNDRVYEQEALLQVEKDSCQEAMDRQKAKHRQQNQQLEHSNRQYEQRRTGFDAELKSIQSQTTRLFSKEEDIRQACLQLQTSVDTASTQLSQAEAKLTEDTNVLQEKEAKLMGAQKAVEDLALQLEKTEARMFEIDTQLLEDEKTRRKRHNQFQELKGNIRVFCRMRPSLASEGASVQVQFDGGGDSDKMEFSEQVMASTVTNKRVTKTYPFSFDKIFTPDHGQAECFEEISQLVQSALDGYNVCIFAYGQTGSGKTFTMQGPHNNDATHMGMIPRAVHQIYQVAQMLSDRGWTYTMEGQFLEIYNETIHDLLGDVSDYGKIKHDIRHEKNGRTTVAEMTTVQLDSPNKVKTMLRKANHNRATGATLLNERSSRSHSVFILRLSGHNETTGERTSGVLNLIDLAGSERLNASGATGDRLTETKAINKSLSCLGDVIHALAKNKEGAYIPYRNSKLTYLLQNSLGGNCKTLMFVNISPLAEHFGETLCSLRFATKVNSCRIGTARKAK
ncbi:unnamed protein product [Absidia cylindrospora]